MHYIIYKTTNKINGKYYIGAHQTKDLKDHYKGSGIALKAAFAEYGRKNFTREILEICNSADEMYEREAQIVSEAIVNDRNSYNLIKGGKGGPGTPKPEQQRKKISESLLGRSRAGMPNLGRPASMDIIQLVETVREIGIARTAEKFGITESICRHRYRRAEKKLSNK